MVLASLVAVIHTQMQGRCIKWLYKSSGTQPHGFVKVEVRKDMLRTAESLALVAFKGSGRSICLTHHVHVTSAGCGLGSLYPLALESIKASG